jgi:hypothetical protein
MTNPDAVSRPPLSQHAPTFLSTEHWGLLGTRSMVWNEAFSRVSTFLNALSASVVALALVADATGFDRSFRVFALILLPMIFFLGLATYVRVTQINLEDVFMVAAMNRLRHAYIVHAPELEPYFTTGWRDDAAGVWEDLPSRSTGLATAVPSLLHHDPNSGGHDRRGDRRGRFRAAGLSSRRYRGLAGEYRNRRFRSGLGSAHVPPVSAPVSAPESRSRPQPVPLASEGAPLVLTHAETVYEARRRR